MQKGVLIDFALRLCGGNDGNGRYTARFRHLAEVVTIENRISVF